MTTLNDNTIDNHYMTTLSIVGRCRRKKHNFLERGNDDDDENETDSDDSGPRIPRFKGFQNLAGIIDSEDSDSS